MHTPCHTMRYWYNKCSLLTSNLYSHKSHKFSTNTIMKPSIKHLFTTLIVALVVSTAAHSSAKGGDDYFHSNPLTLNGMSLDYKTFWKGSKGVLALVKGNPTAYDSPKVPFKIYLKRNGQAINKGLSSDSREHLEVQIAPILELAQFGDELVIEPARKSDTNAKRVIRLTKVNLMYMIFGPMLSKNGDGC